MLNTLKAVTGAGGTWRDVLLRLADLIDPHQDHFADSSKKVDRDALLAIADRLEVMPPGYTAKGRGEHMAERIREALGA